MQLRIEKFSQTEWNAIVSSFTDLTLLQTWEYGEATCRTRSSLEVHRMVFEDQGSLCGAAQALVRRVPLMNGGLVWINRGPLWRRPGSEESAGLVEMLEALRRHWVNGGKMYLRVAPTLLDGELDSRTIAKAGYGFEKNFSGWTSGRLNLLAPLELLQTGLRGNWRNSARKAESSGVTIQIGSSAALFERVIKEYSRLLSRKKFDTTVSPEFLASFQSVAQDRHKFLVLTAMEGSDPAERFLGGIIVARFGDTCEYLVGAINSAGKVRNAGQLLLWKAIEYAKTAGYQHFDVGGLDPERTPPGVLYFKQGVGAKPYTYIGEFDASPGGLVSKAVRWQVRRAFRAPRTG